jgi:CHAT domain-containing protein
MMALLALAALWLILAAATAFQPSLHLGGHPSQFSRSLLANKAGPRAPPGRPEGPAAAASSPEHALIRLRRAEHQLASHHMALAFRALKAPQLPAGPPQSGAPIATLRGLAELWVGLLMDAHREHPGAGYDRRAFEVSERMHARDLLHALAERTGAERPTAAPPPSLAVIQSELLDRDTLLLEFFLGKERSFLWSVTPTSFECFELPARGGVEAEARRAVERWSTTYHWTAEDDTDPVLVNLSTTLLGKVSHQLQDKRLVVVADGALRDLPFAALPLPDRPGEPVVTRHEVVVLPSASVLWRVRQQAAAGPLPRGLLAVLADPVYTLGDPRIAPAAAHSATRPPAATAGAQVRLASDDLADLPRLPYSRLEAAAITALAQPGEVLEALGFAANRHLATSERLRQYRILHFATHAMRDPQEPDRSAMVLSLVDREGRAQEGLLRSTDIARLHLRAALVVLSACRTRPAEMTDGGGLEGLSEAFLAAGATGVLSGVWSVSDKAAAELMESFYRGILVRQMPPAAALRAAELELRQNPHFRAPYFWSAFALEGDWQVPPVLPSMHRRTGS